MSFKMETYQACTDLVADSALDTVLLSESLENKDGDSNDGIFSSSNLCSRIKVKEDSPCVEFKTPSRCLYDGDKRDMGLESALFEELSVFGSLKSDEELNKGAGDIQQHLETEVVSNSARAVPARSQHSRDMLFACGQHVQLKKMKLVLRKIDPSAYSVCGGTSDMTNTIERATQTENTYTLTDKFLVSHADDTDLSKMPAAVRTAQESLPGLSDMNGNAKHKELLVCHANQHVLEDQPMKDGIRKEEEIRSPCGEVEPHTADKNSDSEQQEEAADSCRLSQLVGIRGMWFSIQVPHMADEDQGYCCKLSEYVGPTVLPHSSVPLPGSKVTGCPTKPMQVLGRSQSSLCKRHKRQREENDQCSADGYSTAILSSVTNMEPNKKKKKKKKKEKKKKEKEKEMEKRKHKHRQNNKYRNIDLSSVLQHQKHSSVVAGTACSNPTVHAKTQLQNTFIQPLSQLRVFEKSPINHRSGMEQYNTTATQPVIPNLLQSHRLPVYVTRLNPPLPALTSSSSSSFSHTTSLARPGSLAETLLANPAMFSNPMTLPNSVASNYVNTIPPTMGYTMPSYVRLPPAQLPPAFIRPVQAASRCSVRSPALLSPRGFPCIQQRPSLPPPRQRQPVIARCLPFANHAHLLPRTIPLFPPL